MCTNNILIGILIFLFFLCLSGVILAGDADKPSASFSDLITPMNMENNHIEFESSPIETSPLVSVPMMNADREVIDFDDSPRDDTQRTVTLPSVNTDRGEVQFDYSPRPLNCGTPYC